MPRGFYKHKSRGPLTLIEREQIIWRKTHIVPVKYCKICKKEITSTKFCSYKCRSAWQSNSLEFKEVLSVSHRTPKYKAKMSGDNNPAKRLEVRLKHCGENNVMRIPEIAAKVSGPNNGNWRGGVLPEYCEKWTPELRERIRAFFDYECIMCGRTQEEDCRLLSCHHVEYNKNACCDDQPYCFAALCRSCHCRTNNDRDRWESMLHRIIDEIYDGRSYFTKDEWKEVKKELKQ